MSKAVTRLTPAVKIHEGEVLPPERLPARRRKGEPPRHIRTAADVKRAEARLDKGVLKPARYRDAKSSNLYLVVSTKGVKRWVYRFISPVTGKPNEHGLGELSLANAREKARELREKVSGGADPVVAKANERAVPTFQAACDEWIEVNCTEWRGGREGSQMKNARLLLHTHGEPLADIAVNKITADMIEEALKKLRAQHPAQARRALDMWRTVLETCESRGWITGKNPARWKGCQKERWPKLKAGKRHHKDMPYREVPAFVAALRQHQRDGTSTIALEFLILTAARTGEVLKAQWDEINWVERTWTLPPHRTKQGEEHCVALSGRAMEILEHQRQCSDGGAFIFNGYKPKAALTNKNLLFVLRTTMHISKDVASVHGYRASFKTWCGNETTFAREPVEQCLGHKIGNRVEQAYYRAQALNKMREIMDAWAKFCASECAL